jgi:hypothetical protein
LDVLDFAMSGQSSHPPYWPANSLPPEFANPKMGPNQQMLIVMTLRQRVWIFVSPT